MAFRMVIDYEGGSWQPDVDGTFSQDAFAYHVSISCNHCNNPVCTRVCPTGAMHKDELGLVWPDATKCIGCGYCTMACPYHAPHIDARLKRSSKCDGCRDRLVDGGQPVCVEACPLRALEFGLTSELTDRHPTRCAPSCRYRTNRPRAPTSSSCRRLRPNEPKSREAAS